jgi:peroxiredoxin
MQSIVRMILVITIISAVIMGLIGCSSAPTSPSTPETAQLPIPELSPPQEQGSADTPTATTPTEVSPVPETAPEPEVGPQAGKLAPDFKFANAEGKNISLSDLRGNSVMLNFWATWCGPCKFEIPLIQELAHDKEKAAQGLVLLTVNGGESVDKVARFMNENGLSFPVLLDTKKSIVRAYNVRAIPTTFFIDKDGIIKDIKVGAFSSDVEIQQKLDKIMD